MSHNRYIFCSKKENQNEMLILKAAQTTGFPIWFVQPLCQTFFIPLYSCKTFYGHHNLTVVRVLAAAAIPAHGWRSLRSLREDICGFISTKWICCYTVRLYVRKWVDILLQKGTPQINVSPKGSTNIGSPKWFALPCYHFLFISKLSCNSHLEHHNLTVARSRGSGGARCGTNITNFI